METHVPLLVFNPPTYVLLFTSKSEIWKNVKIFKDWYTFVCVKFFVLNFKLDVVCITDSRGCLFQDTSRVHSFLLTLGFRAPLLDLPTGTPPLPSRAIDGTTVLVRDERTYR